MARSRRMMMMTMHFSLSHSQRLILIDQGCHRASLAAYGQYKRTNEQTKLNVRVGAVGDSPQI